LKLWIRDWPCGLRDSREMSKHLKHSSLGAQMNGQTGAAMKYGRSIKTNGLARPGLEGDGNTLRSCANHLGHLIAKSLKSGVLARLLRGGQASPTRPARLALISRIELGARQTVALVEAEGQHLLVATSSDGATSFFLLNDSQRYSSETFVERVSTASRKSSKLRGRRITSRVAHTGDRPARHVGESSRTSW
jgi:hypothetical protein